MSTPSSASFAQTPPTDNELRLIADILYDHAGIVIAPGKSSMVQSRLQKRLRLLGLSNYKSYLDLVRSEDGSAERREMISALTTNVTHFFREKHHFDILVEKALPEILTRARNGEKIRIWSAGCSNGQEAYTILMTIAETAPDFDKLDIRLLATDIDPVMISRGANAIYDENIVAVVPEALQKKYFQPSGDKFQVCERLRSRASFRELNIHGHWPMKGPFDIIFCRNMMIYFDPDAQAKLWKRFEAMMGSGGWLMVGHSERVPLDTGSQLKPAGITTYYLPNAGPKEGVPKWH
ncbi:hypothetical protein BFP70_14230 [Thioclava sp. SK-1]|uniref:CheR family methyltransferase n=1 Tax=Thioclava sp. SK-1 TaxID=1889770 RepID=UPI0008262169|nr:protein-glutamate O-methyltransferase [Thioclava sp. SK-1]OCX62321.1 hypothetical protein BFP70_14230 [Thioclava sp. SK-1]